MEETKVSTFLRILSHPSGKGWRVVIDRTTHIEHDDGSGLTLAEAGEALDRLEQFVNQGAN